jgi:hypothetical protein
LSDDVKQPILNAYTQIGKANQAITMYSQNSQGIFDSNSRGFAHEEIKKANQLILGAKSKLVNFLKSED